MFARHGFSPALWAVALLGLASQSASAAPWDTLLNRVDADSAKEYRVTEQQGPWMIMACSFSGEEAKNQAHELVLELRKRFNMSAYLFEQKFEHDAEDDGRGLDPLGRPVKMRHLGGDVQQEYAVMVGDFQTVDEAAESLKKIKYMRPECLELEKGRKIYQNLGAFRAWTRTINSEKAEMGPMLNAFTTTNPLLPKEYFNPSGIDDFVVRLNSDTEFSLLECPGKYTVQVAHFTGRTTIKQEVVQEILDSGKVDERMGQAKLIEAGENAEKLAKALRMKKWEAYVFHDRYASIVTVGSFDSVGTPRQDGKIEINPQIHRIMETFGGEQVDGPVGGQQLSTKPKKLLGIPFDLQPRPVEVPRRSIAADYGPPRNDSPSLF